MSRNSYCEEARNQDRCGVQRCGQGLLARTDGVTVSVMLPGVCFKPPYRPMKLIV